uniref:Uncharacterized protein n=1 Tax=Romanomermis culicivorax TaxID=13658 RepID=A0A915JMR4_ROMCU
MSKGKKRKSDCQESECRWREEPEKKERDEKRERSRERWQEEEKGEKDTKEGRKSSSRKRVPAYFQQDGHLDVSYSSQAPSLDRARNDECYRLSSRFLIYYRIKQVCQRSIIGKRYGATFLTVSIGTLSDNAWRPLLPPILDSTGNANAATHIDPAHMERTKLRGDGDTRHPTAAAGHKDQHGQTYFNNKYHTNFGSKSRQPKARRIQSFGILSPYGQIIPKALGGKQNLQNGLCHNFLVKKQMDGVVFA